MIETKTREPLLFSSLDDEPTDNLPEPVALTPEQLAAQAEVEEQDRLRRLHWDDQPGALRQLDGGDAGDALVASTRV